MRIAIAGGTGLVGSHVVRLAEAAGHEVRVLSRSTGVDLVNGGGLDLTGVDAVIDVTGPSGLSSVKFFETVTGNLLRAGASASVKQHVALSIVGAAGAPYGYYRGKAAQERMVAAGEVPWTILRATQFFEFALNTALRLGPLVVVPAMRSQPVAAASVAERLLEVVEGGPAGNAPDIAGPQELRMAEVARATLAARGENRRVLEVPMPGGFGRALRNGGILPGPDAQLIGPELAEWLR